MFQPAQANLNERLGDSAQHFSELRSTQSVRDWLTTGLNCNMSELMQNKKMRSYVKWNHGFGYGTNLSIENCSLHIIDRSTARKCLLEAAPNGITFMGDSVTRYQYLNLVHFLEHGIWNSDSSKPNENGHKFGSWNEFLRTTNQRLGGHEICDCHRLDSRDTNAIENRYYADGDVKIAHLQLFGRHSRVRIHNVTMLNLSSCSQSRCVQSLCQPGECASSVLPLDDIGTILQPGTFQRMAGSIPSSHIFLNAGLWWQANGGNSFVNHQRFIIDEVLRFRNATPGVKVHWKMTTAKKGVRPEFEFARSLVDSGAFDSIYDAWSLTADITEHYPELMWDLSHFEGPVYQGLNQALLAYLCSLSKEK
jgi:hypothetical protein